MSARAIQRLREQREQNLDVNRESDSDGSDDDETDNRKPMGGFGGFMDDDDSESDTSSSQGNSDAEDKDIDEEKVQKSNNHTNQPATDSSDGENQVASGKNDDDDEPNDNAEDLDAILEEFKAQDVDDQEDGCPDNKNMNSYFSVITSGMDIKDLDIDHVTRTSLLGRNEGAAGTATRRGRQVNVFGPPRDGWPRPPRYVGGGIGMSTYQNEQRALPWPYCDMKTGDDRCPAPERWFNFTHSDSYERDCEDFERVKQSGDPNVMALFVSHHPFVIEPLLQLSNLLYQTNQAQEGLSLLKRVLWVYECACLNSFLKLDGTVAMMDYDVKENKFFFDALFRLVRVSYVAGLSRACFAVSRMLLSMDPLRDPMGVLLAIDHFALLENSESNDLWLVEFVESEKVQIYWKDDLSGEEYTCDLLDLPNWVYSYALALYRTHVKTPSPESERKANNALTLAFKRFPHIMEDLLVKNEVDLAGRSFQTDWPSVLGYVRSHTSQLSNQLSKTYANDAVLKARISQAYDTVSRIFVQQNYKLWSADHILKWCFSNMQSLKESNVNIEDIPQPSPAIIRYEKAETSNYEDRFQTMPLDAVPLDPALVARAQHINPNLPRLMQRGPRGGLHEDELAFAANQHGFNFAGPPTQEIDPDWPLLEIFWRSALPWAHVEGIPPPRR